MPRLRTGQRRRLEKDIVGWCSERLDPPVAAQSRYGARTHVLLLLLAAVRNLFLESALMACGWLGVEELPSPRALLYRLRAWCADGHLEGALVHLNEEVLREARRRRSLPRAAVGALDYTDEPYYGKESRGSCCRAPEKRGTTWFHRHAALSLIVRNARYTVAWVRVGPLTGHGRVVEVLLDAAQEWVEVKLLIMDRGLYTRAVKALLRARGIRVLLAAPKWKAEKRMVERCRGLRWHAEPWRVGGQDGWTLIVADNGWLRRELADRRVEEGYSLWLTDLPLRGSPLPLIRAYNRRWSIENAFQEEDRFQARTKSPDVRLRFCLLLLAVVLRNLWLLLRQGWEDLTTFLLREVLHHQVFLILKGGKRRDRLRIYGRSVGG